ANGRVKVRPQKRFMQDGMDIELGKPLLAQAVAETGNNDHRQIRLNALHGLGQLVAIHARHGEVGDNKVVVMVVPA
ncbi:MAG: hypothetical protein VCE74_04520, partial [Alphaproteobacteria bacterium]